jgi:diacylglycerol kinase family enzyme
VGTANNIAKTLRHTPQVKAWSLPSPAADNRFDCGQMSGLPEESFFLESTGFGVFPQLIHNMRKEDTSGMEPSQKLSLTLEVLLEVVKKFRPQKARIKADGISIKGKFLMVELMNIRYVGPNLDLAPQADPGDGFFDLAIIRKGSRKQFLTYLEKRIATPDDLGDMRPFVKTLRIKKMSLRCPEPKFHIDDTLLSGMEGKKMVLTLLPGAFELIA